MQAESVSMVMGNMATGVEKEDHELNLSSQIIMKKCENPLE